MSVRLGATAAVAFVSVLGGCTREPMTTRIVAEKHYGGIQRSAIVSEDRWICFTDYAIVLKAEVGKPFACRWTYVK